MSIFAALFFISSMESAFVAARQMLGNIKSHIGHEAGAVLDSLEKHSGHAAGPFTKRQLPRTTFVTVAEVSPRRRRLTPQRPHALTWRTVSFQKVMKHWTFLTYSMGCACFVAPLNPSGPTLVEDMGLFITQITHINVVFYIYSLGGSLDLVWVTHDLVITGQVSLMLAWSSFWRKMQNWPLTTSGGA